MRRLSQNFYHKENQQTLWSRPRRLAIWWVVECVTNCLVVASIVLMVSSFPWVSAGYPNNHVCQTTVPCATTMVTVSPVMPTGSSPTVIVSVSNSTCHCSDFIMGAMASQISSLTIVYSTVYSATDERKHQSSASLAFVRGIHRWPVNSPHKMFPFDDVIVITPSATAGVTRSMG